MNQLEQIKQEILKRDLNGWNMWLIKYIQEEVARAYKAGQEAERERVKAKRDDIWDILCQMDTNIKPELDYADEIINLINSKK